MIKPLPDLDSVYSMLIHDEQQSELQAALPSFAAESTSFFTTWGTKPFSHKVNFEPRKFNNEPRKFNSNNNYPQADPRKFNNYPSPQGLFCKYCKRPGHVIEKCHRLHGYPPNFQFSKGKKTVACVQGMEMSFPQGDSSGSVPNAASPQSYGPDSSLHGFS
ncbi:uncharacterized protein LOC132051575 [Lycium ferocissimum]|uniref:uncharacterized protein LOC132051575 n=1 Tax=Lycium ferocissimum TaxID=112874 RepID=UPI0028156F7C|nr:uncharacterized protein LOC132051575 [Lycium ferocissimum]